jgi:hypothetical protein
MSSAIEAICHHVDAWVAILENRLALLSDQHPDPDGTVSAERSYVQHELDAMRAHMAELLSDSPPEPGARPYRRLAESGFFFLAHILRAHCFRRPNHAFDMEAFAPEAREFLSEPGKRLYDACAAMAACERRNTETGIMQ